MQNFKCIHDTQVSRFFKYLSLNKTKTLLNDNNKVLSRMYSHLNLILYLLINNNLIQLNYSQNTVVFYQFV